MSERYFTLDEAEALIPRLAESMAEVKELKVRVDEKLKGYQAHPPDGPAEMALMRGQVEFLVTEINERLQSIAELGCHPKDLEIGLVDFPSKIDGKEVCLCWKLGERSIYFWHETTEGYSGRRPLLLSIHQP